MQWVKRVSVYIISLLFLISCSVPLKVKDRKSIWTDIKLTESEAMKKGAPYGATQLSDLTLYTLKFSDNGRVFNTIQHEKYLLYVNDKAEKATSFSWTLNNRQKVNMIQAATIKPDGTVIPVPPEMIKRTTATNDDGDELTKIEFIYPAVEPGAILFTKYEFEPNYIFDPIWDVYSSYPIIQSRFALFMPQVLLDNGYNFNTYTQGVTLAKPYIQDFNTPNLTIAQRGKMISYQLLNIDPDLNEDYALPSGHREKRIEFLISYKKKKDWKSLFFLNQSGQSSIDYKSIFEAGSNVSKLIQTAGFKTLATAEDKIDSVYNYIQANVKQNDDYLFKSGTEPKAAEDVAADLSQKHRLRDVNALAVSIFRELGFKAYLTYNKTFNRGFLYEPKVDLSEFNSALVWVRTPDNRSYWLDFEVAYTYSNDIHYLDQGTKALVVRDDLKSIEFKVIPTTTHRANRAQIQIDASIDDELNLVGTFKETLVGSSSFYLRRQLDGAKDKNKQNEILNNRVTASIPGVEVANVKITQNNQKGLVLVADIKKANFVKKTGRYFIMSPSLFPLNKRFTELSNSERKNSVYFIYPRTHLNRVNIKYPESMEIAFQPYRKVARSKDVTIDTRMFLDEESRTVSINSTTEIKRYSIDPRESEQYKKVIDAYSAFTQQKIRFSKK